MNYGEYKRRAALRDRITFASGPVWRCFIGPGEAGELSYHEGQEFVVKLTANYVYFGFAMPGEFRTDGPWCVDRREWQSLSARSKSYAVEDANGWSRRKCGDAFFEAVAAWIDRAIDTLTESIRAARKSRPSLTPSFC